MPLVLRAAKLEAVAEHGMLRDLSITRKVGKWNAVRASVKSRFDEAQLRHSFCAPRPLERSSTEIDVLPDENEKMVAEEVQISNLPQERLSRRDITTDESDASPAAVASLRKHVSIPVTVEENRTALDIPRWKKAWQLRKISMELGQGGRQGPCSTTAPLERQQSGLVGTRHAPRDISRAQSQAALAGLTSYYKFMKAKHPNVAVSFSASASSASSLAASFSSTSSTPIVTPTAALARSGPEQGEPRTSWMRDSTCETRPAGEFRAASTCNARSLPTRSTPAEESQPRLWALQYDRDVPEEEEKAHWAKVSQMLPSRRHCASVQRSKSTHARCKQPEPARAS